MKIAPTLLLIVFFGSISAQNLVLNPSFEDYFDCPKNKSELFQAKNWSQPTKGTSDYFNNCSKKAGYNNFVGYQTARSGKAYTGFYAYSKEDYREYIQGELKKTLEKGKTYAITFYISLAKHSTYATQNLGIAFFDKKKKDTSKTRTLGTKLILKQIKKSKKKSLINKTISYKDIYNPSKKTTEEWTKIAVNYKAKGFEKFLVIGNFDSNLNTKTKKVQQSKFEPFSYYYIDDISVKEIKSYIPKKTYIFKNVLFNSDKATLLNNSIEELNKLSQHLTKNKHLNIEIYGHTDNVGLEKRNQELSQERAKAVSVYLIEKGLDRKRIKWFGFGASKPLVKNNSEENRAKNRRVEFKLD